MKTEANTKAGETTECEHEQQDETHSKCTCGLESVIGPEPKQLPVGKRPGDKTVVNPRPDWYYKVYEVRRKRAEQDDNKGGFEEAHREALAAAKRHEEEIKKNQKLAKEWVDYYERLRKHKAKMKESIIEGLLGWHPRCIDQVENEIIEKNNEKHGITDNARLNPSRELRHKFGIKKTPVESMLDESELTQDKDTVIRKRLEKELALEQMVDLQQLTERLEKLTEEKKGVEDSGKLEEVNSEIEDAEQKKRQYENREHDFKREINASVELFKRIKNAKFEERGAYETW